MRIRLIVFLAYQGLFLAWCFKIHRHFFEFTLPDQIGLLIIAAVPLVLSRIRRFPEFRFAWVLLLTLPLLLFPAVNASIQFLDDAWLPIYLALFLTGFSLLLIGNNRLNFIAIVPILLIWFIPFPFEVNQKLYYDKLSTTFHSRKGELDIVKWKEDEWIYYNKSLIISTADGHIHSETMVHTLMPLFAKPNVLLLGSDHGFLQRELDKYLLEYDHVPYDYQFYHELQNRHETNNNTLSRSLDLSIPHFLEDNSGSYDLIIIDLPDPENIEYAQFYSDSFFSLCINNLSPQGMLITNAGNVFLSNNLNNVVLGQIESLGLIPLELQAQVPTLGQRSWIIGSRQPVDLKSLRMTVDTRWIDQEAIDMMLSKGKPSYPL